MTIWVFQPKLAPRVVTAAAFVSENKKTYSSDIIFTYCIGSFVAGNLGLDTKNAFLWQLVGTLLARIGCWRPSLIVKFPPGGFLGTFSMSFHIIFWTYSEKISLLWSWTSIRCTRRWNIIQLYVCLSTLEMWVTTRTLVRQSF